MLQNARVAGFTVAELLRENQQRGNGSPTFLRSKKEKEKQRALKQ